MKNRRGTRQPLGKKKFWILDEEVEETPSSERGRCLCECLNGLFKLLNIEPSIAEGDFLQAGDFESLVVFDGADELGSFEQGFVGAGVELGVAAAEDLT